MARRKLKENLDLNVENIVDTNVDDVGNNETNLEVNVEAKEVDKEVNPEEFDSSNFIENIENIINTPKELEIQFPEDEEQTQSEESPEISSEDSSSDLQLFEEEKKEINEEKDRIEKELNEEVNSTKEEYLRELSNVIKTYAKKINNYKLLVKKLKNKLDKSIVENNKLKAKHKEYEAELERIINELEKYKFINAKLLYLSKTLISNSFDSTTKMMVYNLYKKANTIEELNAIYENLDLSNERTKKAKIFEKANKIFDPNRNSEEDDDWHKLRKMAGL